MSVSGEIQKADSMPEQLLSALTLERRKSGSKDLHGHSSPVSPLRTRACASSSSSSSGSTSGNPENGIAGRRTRSGEHTVSTEDSAGVRSTRPGHRRSGSEPLIHFGSAGVADTSARGASSPVSSPATNVLPAGNICPSGKIGRSGMMSRSAARSDVLGVGSKNYGHGSIIRGGGSNMSIGEAAVGYGLDPVMRRAMVSVDPEEVRRAGNEQYKKGRFAEAMRLYDRGIAICPENAAFRSNRAAALIGLGRLGDAVKSCEEAVKLDPSFVRAYQRLASIHIRLGQVESARRHLFQPGLQTDPIELQKLQAVEMHMRRCADARKAGDWTILLMESNAAINAGADSSSMLITAKAEALLWLHQLEEADSTISSALKLEISSPTCSQAKFFGLLSNSYTYKVNAQIEMALGRFENAIASAETARRTDPGNFETTMTLNKVRSVARARSQGNEFFNAEKFEEAYLAYGEGLKYDPSNPVLYCNRAACMSKLGQWDKSIEDCNEALRIHPNYTKALLRRAASNGKLERWSESLRDYEVLREELPGDNEVAEALSHAQAALKASRGDNVPNMTFGGEVELITELEHFQTAISLHGVFVVHFMSPSNQHCIQISPFMDILCRRFPSVNFLKVDINKNPSVCKAETVRIVPTIKIYKNGVKVKEMICPSQQLLEHSVRLFCL